MRYRGENVFSVGLKLCLATVPSALEMSLSVEGLTA